MNANVKYDRILKLQEVIDIVGIKKVTIYNMMKIGKFPKQVKLTPTSVGWKLSDIQGWLKNLQYAD